MSKNERFNTLKTNLNKSSFYKLDCSLNQVEIEELFPLIYIYVIAGFSAIDVNCNPDLVILAKESILKAIKESYKFNENIENEPFLFISCFSSELIKKDILDLENNLRSCQINGAEIFELHIDDINFNLLKEKLLLVKKIFNAKPISINLSRNKLSNARIIELIKFFKFNIQKELIIEVDGREKNNNENYNNTLQAISTADIINKQLIKKEIAFSRLPILLSGGTNYLTLELAKECNVNFNGITIGNYAKESFTSFINKYSFENFSEVKNYINKIKKLIV